MANVEWRFPLTNYLSIGSPIGEIRFPGVQGALFADLGRAWSEQATDRGWLGAYGLGLRMSLFGPLILRLDMGWRYGLGNVAAYSLRRTIRSTTARTASWHSGSGSTTDTVNGPRMFAALRVRATGAAAAMLLAGACGRPPASLAPEGSFVPVSASEFLAAAARTVPGARTLLASAGATTTANRR